jgi:uncharacterized SAM-dependent methyltransferase
MKVIILLNELIFMQYFKHAELVKKYHVSLKTVHNWIDAAKQGKIVLELHSVKNRTYITNTSENILVLDQLSAKGKKYRNALHHKVAHPTPDFYMLYSRKQILDIISNLNIHREIPRQYNYFDQGAVNWEKHAEGMWNAKTANILKGTVDLLHANLTTIDTLIGGHSRVNVIDIGPGNAMPVRQLLEHLLETNVLHRYIAVDISEEMLRIAKRNIEEWFGDRVQFEGYVRDITYERFDDTLVDDMLDQNAEKTVNLVLLLGATPVNFQSPRDLIKVIYSSMGPDDLLIYSSDVNRSYFDVNADAGARALSSKYSYIFDLLNIDESTYDVEMGFNTKKRVRYIRVRLKIGLTINFKFENGERNVKLDKGDTILLWRAWHQTAVEIITDFEETGFTLLQASLTKDRQFFLSISGVETKEAYKP